MSASDYAGAFCALSLLVCMWGLYCNNQAYKQRRKILNGIHDASCLLIDGGRDWRFLYEAFEAVDYSRHVFDLMMFRDPMRRYPAVVRETAA